MRKSILALELPHHRSYDMYYRQELTGRIKDDTVPYPSAAIDTTDHFAEWSEQGIEVESDSDGIMVSWRKNPELRSGVERKKGWTSRLGTLPPVLRYRYPYNYVRL
jgi:hypothetical protein